ncbi:unnamed protein product [Rotaria socialis]|uniref:Uncharacterized protein n=1 Tax=Rotaria socialis TaxID=392032 RepID=A0A820XNF3_9BILA|nr:unnamed protein product [Rotaria socialis]
MLNTLMCNNPSQIDLLCRRIITNNMFWNKNGATTESVVNDYLTWRLKNKSSSSTTNRLFTIVHKIGSDCERIYTPQQSIFYFQYVPSFSLNNC